MPSPGGRRNLQLLWQIVLVRDTAKKIGRCASAYSAASFRSRPLTFQKARLS
jgi:hypothetical protein